MSDNELIRQPERTALVDLRSQAMAAMSVDDIKAGLAEYQERRNAFRAWLLSQMREGVHYGYPPGLAPKFDSNGNVISSQWDKRKNEYKTVLVSPESWTAKPSLYKAGADFICDLMNVVDTYEADMAAWEQLGKPAKTFVFTCRLYPKGAKHCPETMIGEGRGCRTVGQKGGDENNTVKMAKKCAKVDAVLNGYGLADLFTQDLEELQPELHPNPEPKTDAPKAQPRDKRVEFSECKSLFGDWKSFRKLQGKADTPAEFETWVGLLTGMLPKEVQDFGAWTVDDLAKCRKELNAEMGLS